MRFSGSLRGRIWAGYFLGSNDRQAVQIVGHALLPHQLELALAGCELLEADGKHVLARSQLIDRADQKLIHLRQGAGLKNLHLAPLAQHDRQRQDAEAGSGRAD